LVHIEQNDTTGISQMETPMPYKGEIYTASTLVYTASLLVISDTVLTG
jgi:hypothetical protein